VTDLRATFAVAGTRIRLTDATGRVGGGEVGASGEVVVEKPAPRLDLRVRGRLPLALVAQLRPEVREASGFATIDATVTGTTAAPRPGGDVTVEDGRLTLRDYPDTLRDVRARAAVSPQALRLVDFSASLGGGRLTGSGDLAWNAETVGAYRFTVAARRVALPLGRGWESAWDADLELGGLGQRALLRGEARLVRGSYVSEAPLLRLLTESRGGGPGGEGAGIPLDLRVRLDDNLVVRTAVARFRAGGTLSVQGTTSAPVVFGAIDATDGQIIFRRQRFTIVNGSARFSDPRRIDPLIDVQAVSRIQDYDVTLRLTGRAEDMQIRVSTSPPLPEDDALSLVAFGKTRADLGKSGAGAVAGELAGIVIGDLLGFGAGEGRLVDVLEVDTAADATRTVKVGKRVTARTLVLYSQGVERAEERRLRIEYELLGPLVVAGEQDFRGGVGADVVLRLRFR
jgi:translocation and assembly module TamB